MDLIFMGWNGGSEIEISGKVRLKNDLQFDIYGGWVKNKKKIK